MLYEKALATFFHVFSEFFGRPGHTNHGFRVGLVAKITLLPALEFSPFWFPFGVPFGEQSAPKIMFWLTLGALGNEFGTLVASTF